MGQWSVPKFFPPILMKIQLFITYALQEENECKNQSEYTQITTSGPSNTRANDFDVEK